MLNKGVPRIKLPSPEGAPMTILLRSPMIGDDIHIAISAREFDHMITYPYLQGRYHKNLRSPAVTLDV